MDGVEKCQNEGNNRGVQSGRLATLNSQKSPQHGNWLTDRPNWRAMWSRGKNKTNKYICIKLRMVGLANGWHFFSWRTQMIIFGLYLVDVVPISWWKYNYKFNSNHHILFYKILVRVLRLISGHLSIDRSSHMRFPLTLHYQSSIYLLVERWSDNYHTDANLTPMLDKLACNTRRTWRPALWPLWLLTPVQEKSVWETVMTLSNRSYRKDTKEPNKAKEQILILIQ